MKILEELFYGNVSPNDREFPTNGRLFNLSKLLTRNTDKLQPMLSKEASAVFEALLDTQMEYNALLEQKSFIYGFRLGARIMLEALRDDEENID
ncbi:MAG: hypothetical protein IJ766_05995 [Clostridia bacterium]|nr:hypothetical protein [Clostridia bacterium]